jgi:hypothetical protein
VVAPDDFDAGPSGLWKVVQKEEDEKGKQTWKCEFPCGPAGRIINGAGGCSSDRMKEAKLRALMN